MKMNPEELLQKLISLRNELDGKIVWISADMGSKLLGVILQAFQLQAEYQEARRTGKLERSDFLETRGAPLSKADLETLERAADVHTEIVERIQNRRLGG